MQHVRLIGLWGGAVGFYLYRYHKVVRFQEVVGFPGEEVPAGEERFFYAIPGVRIAVDDAAFREAGLLLLGAGPPQEKQADGYQKHKSNGQVSDLEAQ